jgi:CRP/FNR family cyclic AMP-dependent transcriptional regulator
MLSVGPRARRFSPSQDIYLKNDFRALSVIYITDTTFSQAHNPNTGLPSAGTDELRETQGHGRTRFSRRRVRARWMGRFLVKANSKPPFNVATFLAAVDGGSTVSTYRKNKRIFLQGDPADSVFYIQEGRVKVCVASEQGKEAVVAIHAKGDFFGEGCLTGQPRRLATVATMTESVIMRLDKAAIVRMLHDEPKFSEVFMSYLLARNARVEEDLVDQLFNSSEKRLARLLLLMANFGKEAEPEPVIAKISQETLAEMVGTTRSRVSRFMNKFRKLGFIDYNGHLEVHSSLLNVVLHDTPKIRRGADSGE